MPNYAIDTEKQRMTATGIVAAVMEWDEFDGRRKPSDRQARNEDTGMPLWAVEVIYTEVSFGRESTVTARVTVESESKPQPVALSPIRFVGLRAEVRINKAGGITEYWSAEGVVETPRVAAKPGEKAVA